ncbi:MAG: 16S rRNA (cytosine(1402)-N(4))-methyltransferase RsmH [Firmicutes bacterium]|jgi:16S rRNA (cytosine1402-N4)-methyltransferase|nr:16S rRNA (cytosine(1402)-N(4))-methyltransferase RsmH [Bacillota bacterium]
MDFKHVTVLLKETVEGLNINPNGVYVDGTLGGGGHSEYLLERLDNGILVGIDQDKDALEAAGKRLKRFGKKFMPYHSNFSNIKNVIKDIGLFKIDGMMIDLGVSSYQLDEAERGFSYMNDGLLDMRMNRSNPLSAEDIVNDYSEEKLAEIIFKYGEEKFSRRIARNICEAREEKRIRTTAELVDIIKESIPARNRREGPHPAKRTFQAIRIEVNNELGIIEQTIQDATSVLNKGGRLSIITFHSLEDRIVKNAYKELAKGCICPPEMPICTCNNEPKLKIITRKPIIPSAEEIEFNPRARSAKLRIAEKL